MIYIFGTSGMLGGYLKRQFPEATCFVRKDYDISLVTKENLKSFLKLEDGDVVINAAGVIPQSGCTDYHTVNGIFPVLLGELCADTGAHLVHVSTDCVYSGTKGDYTESDPGDSLEPYGLSKIEGEKTSGTIVTTSIIGEELCNKVSLLEWVKGREGKLIHGYTNHIWNGVTCWQLSKIIREIISKKLFWKGKRHVFSPRAVSKCELIQIIARVYNVQVKIVPASDYTSKTMTLATNYHVMFDIPDIEEQVREQSTVTLGV